MAFTQSDLDAINKAYAGGYLSVRFADRTVVFGSEEDLKKRKKEIEAELNKATANQRLSPRYRVAGFSDA